MKLLKKFLVAIFAFAFINIGFVSATTTCEYSFRSTDDLVITFDGAGTPTVNQQIYAVQKTPIILDWFYEYNSGKIKYGPGVAESQMKEELGKCPASVYVCDYESTSDEGISIGMLVSDEHGIINVQKKIYLAYSARAMNEAYPELKDLPNGQAVFGSEYVDNAGGAYKACSDYGIPILREITGGVCAIFATAGTLVKNVAVGADIMYLKYKECKTVKYTGTNPTYNLACPNVGTYESTFDEAINTQCDKKDGACVSDKMSKVSDAEDTLRTYCREIMSHHVMDDGAEQDCLESCVVTLNSIQGKKKNAGLLGSDYGECGFSQRFMNWVINIFKWIKYVLPVFVIIFGIIDFLKAISADKEDEMKKAQRHFVIRLIAAALTFVIPLILTFILEKMGFSANGCGLW